MIRVIAEAPTTEEVVTELRRSGWECKDGTLTHGDSVAFIEAQANWARAIISLACEIERSACAIEEGIHRRRLSERGA